MKSVPSWVKTLIKAAVAAGLIAWLLKRGVLNFETLRSSLAHWPLLILIGAIIYMQMALTALRWNLLLRSQGVPFRYRDAASLTMIGMLFNLVSPSSVGGDVMKSYYVHRRAGNRQAQAMATIVLDRVLGLLSLLMVAAGAAVPSLSTSGSNAKLRALAAAAVVGALAGAAILTVAIRFSPRGGRPAPANKLVGFAVQAFGSLAEYRKRPGVLLAGLGLGAISFALACAGFYCAALATGVPEFPLRYLFLVPLGLVASALPISPAGIGVGQVAFAELFRLSSNGVYTFGANAFTVFQTLQFVVSLSGFFPYLAYRHKNES